MKNGLFTKRVHSLLAACLQFTGINGTLIVAMLLGSSLVPARAGTEVVGQLDAMQLRAEHASTSEVLAALAASFKLTYRLPPNINRNLNGLYSGSLRSVLARVLDGTDYFIKNLSMESKLSFCEPLTDLAAPTWLLPTPHPKPGVSAPLPPLASYLTNN